MLDINNTILVVVDVQGKLASLVHKNELFLENLKRMIKGAKVLDLPILWTEQNPEGIGATIPEIAELLTGLKPLRKTSFSCCGDKNFLDALKATQRTQVLITGIETHICVYQTTMELLAAGYEVEVVTDAVSSRTPENKEVGLQKMKVAGAGLTGTETALFELLKVSTGAKFKEILKVVK